MLGLANMSVTWDLEGLWTLKRIFWVWCDSHVAQLSGDCLEQLP